nr:RNA-directed DNA polymerase, eukaryota [Tanacetum cinerariifolium]
MCAMIPTCCDDDDDYNSAITPNEPVDSLSIGDGHLNTIPATKSEKYNKSSVENLVPNPNFYSVDDQSLSDEDIPEKIFSNPLFDEEVISMKIDPHHFNVESDLIESLLNHDSSIIPSSSKIDSLLDEFADELTLLKSIPPRVDETDCYPDEDIRLIERLLYDNSSPRPPEEFVFENSNVETESFSPSPIPVKDSDSFIKEIDLSFTPDDPMPSGIEEDDYDSERDILIREELLDNYSFSLPVIESYHFDIPSFFRPPKKPPDGNTGILNIKMMGDNSEHKYSQKLKDSCQRILSSKSLFPQLQLGIRSKVWGCMSRTQSWNKVVDKMVNRLSRWKMKTLSIGGHLTLLKAVLGSMPIYNMSIFKKSIWVRWNNVLASKEKGGLGVSSLFTLNRALLFKWVWRFFTQKETLWARVISAIHGVDGGFGSAKKSGQAYIWYSIIKEMERWCWNLTGLRDFNVASARKFIDDKRLPIVSTTTRWIKEVPIKVNILAWKVESSTHLFFDCRIFKENFQKICNWWNVCVTELSSFDGWVSWIRNLRLPSKIKSLLEGVCYGLWWFIWAFRNKMVFCVAPPSKASIFDDQEDPHHFNAESDLIESLLNHDSSIIPSFSKIDSLLDEFVGELTLLKSIPPGVDETDCYPEEDIRLIEMLLYDNSSPRPSEEFVSENSDAETESFSPSPIPVKDSDSFMKEIDLSFTPDDPMPPGIKEDDYDFERDILIREELLDNYSLSLPVIESYHFDIPSFSCPPAKPPDGNTEILNIKMMGDNSEQKVPIPGLTITLVLNQEKSPNLLSHQGLEIFQLSAKCPMVIHGKNIPILDVPLFHFYPP